MSNLFSIKTAENAAVSSNTETTFSIFRGLLFWGLSELEIW